MARRRVPLDEQGRPIPEERGAEPEPDCECPRLDPEEWHEVESDWSDIGFLRASLPALAGVPFRYGAARRGLLERAAQLGLRVPDAPMLLLGPGRVRRLLLLEVEGEAPDVWRPGGFAFSRLVPAPFGSLRREASHTLAAAQERYGGPPDHLWVWYLTCSRCSAARKFETLFVAHYRGTPASRPS
ncbi:MAG: hypothetical protein RMK15_04410 [Chloroflexota bacterium]|nr:hypothetical protein [Chloroflexota bacterium]